MHFIATNFLILVFCFFTCYSVTRDSNSAEDVPEQVCTLIMLQKYRNAELLEQNILKKCPDDIGALNMLCTIKQTEIMDYESYTVFGNAFDSYTDSVFNVISLLIDDKKGRDSINAMFYMASILGSKSIILAKKGIWAPAISSAVKSSDYLKKVIKKDPLFFQAYYGIGMFNYYLSQNLKWVPFLGDKREDALKQIDTAALYAPVPYNYAAKNSLCWILIDAKRPETADSIASDVLKKYPENTIFIRIKVKSNILLKRWNIALQLAGRLLELSSERNPRNWAELVAGYHAVALCYENMKNYQCCKDAAVKALSLPIPEKYRSIPFVKKYLKYFEDVSRKYGA
jgi:tetratricopeptide (TPR) repeat protein